MLMSWLVYDHFLLILQITGVFMEYSICLSLAWDDASKYALLHKVILM